MCRGDAGLANVKSDAKLETPQEEEKMLKVRIQTVMKLPLLVKDVADFLYRNII